MSGQTNISSRPSFWYFGQFCSIIFFLLGQLNNQLPCGLHLKWRIAGKLIFDRELKWFYTLHFLLSSGTKYVTKCIIKGECTSKKK